MGTLNKSLIRFQPEYLHEELGLNLIMPVLPMHGPRDTGGLISGERTLSGDVMDTLHTGAQAVWDLRRIVWWLRESEGAPAIGALGHSLGGYAVSLLASLEEDLDCVVAGNPAVDPSHLFWSNALAIATHSLSAEGIREETLKALLRPVSPLALEPVVPHERRAIFAGVRSTGWCPRSRRTACGATGNSRASPGIRGPTSALYAPRKAARSSKRPSAPPTCFPRRRQGPRLSDKQSSRSRPESSRRPVLACTHRARPIPAAASRASVGRPHSRVVLRLARGSAPLEEK